MGRQPQDDASLTGLVNRLKESGETAFNKLSEQLLESPTFMAAFRRALEAKGQVDKTVSGTLDFINLPSKNDFAHLLEEIESLSAQVGRQQRIITSLEQGVVQLNAAVAQLLARLGPASPDPPAER